MLNEMNAARGGPDEAEVLSGTLGRMAEYAVVHFETEEQLLREYDYPALFAQQEAHQGFMERTVELAQRVAKDASAARDETLAFIHDWWLAHIQHEDMKYKSFLLARGVR